MAKPIAQSCPLCLSVNDPIDMLDVTMQHSTPPQSAPMHLCRLCVVTILLAAAVDPRFDPNEVFGAAADYAKSIAAASSAPTSADERDPAVVAAVDQEKENAADRQWHDENERNAKEE